MGGAKIKWLEKRQGTWGKEREAKREIEIGFPLPCRDCPISLLLS